MNIIDSASQSLLDERSQGFLQRVESSTSGCKTAFNFSAIKHCFPVNKKDAFIRKQRDSD